MGGSKLRGMVLHRFRTPDAAVFGGAVGVALVHVLDDAVWHRGPGVGLGAHALLAAVAVLAGVAAVAAFGRVRPGARSALAAAVAVPALANGARHVMHVVDEGPAGGDVTGLAAAAAGLTLLGLAATIPWRHRAERPGRWRTRALATVAGLAAAVGLALPVTLGIVETHAQRSDIGEPPSPAYQDVSFRATDGLRIAGWFLPSRNGATVIAIHGGGSDRRGPLDHVKMLASHGYGVLVYDARGRGESEGSPNSYGWGWQKDAAGALAYLRSRRDVDPERIGALGLSSGADTVIDLAAHHPELAAAVSDGGAMRTFEDIRRTYGLSLDSAPGWILFRTVAALSTDGAPEALVDLVGRTRSPLLLISAGTRDELDFNLDFARAGGPATEHWNLPDSSHTQPIRTHRGEYERRVIAFLDRELRS